MLQRLFDRILTPALSLALLAALVLAGLQWRAAAVLRVEKAEVATAFAIYRDAAERNHAAALQRAAETRARGDKFRQEALDAEYLARVAAEADRDRLRAGTGQLQRLATDLSTSLGGRAGDPTAACSCATAEARIRVLGDVVGALDAFAAGAVEAADGSRRAGTLCERTYDALRQ